LTWGMFTCGRREATHAQGPDHLAANNTGEGRGVCSLTSGRDPERALRAWLVKTSLRESLRFARFVMRARRHHAGLASDLTTPPETTTHAYELANGVNQRQNPASGAAGGCKPPFTRPDRANFPMLVRKATRHSVALPMSASLRVYERR
jgi:hypothetical protein